jgi:hypothetical protein
MSETANETERRKRRSHVPASSVGKRLVTRELKKLGFDARPVGSNSDKHLLLVSADDSAPKAIQVRTAHSALWYVRRARFARRADQVTVYVLLGAGTKEPARFFVVKDSDLTREFREPPTWKAFVFIDAGSAEKYENNWEILR